MPKTKVELRVFLDRADVRRIDRLIARGDHSNRSEAVRSIVHEWFRSRERIRGILEEHEERIRRLEQLERLVGR